MGEVREPRDVALIVGMLAREEGLFEKAVERLAWYGAVAVRSEVMGFTETDYYTAEMGPGLLRQFVAFERLISPGQLAGVKHVTNELEAELKASEAGRLGVARPINLDPGYVDASKLVLATTKDFSHRVYIGLGMYAEATLAYRGGRWHGWPYTYPDYGSGRYDGFLTAVRQWLLERRKEA